MNQLLKELGEMIVEMQGGRWDSAISLRFDYVTKELGRMAGVPFQEFRERCYALADVK